MPGKPWTEDEFAYVNDTLDRKVKDVAADMGCSPARVQNIRHHLRAGKWMQKRTRWTDLEDALVKESPHLTAQQLADKLGRTANAVEIRRKVIGAKGGKWAGKNPNYIAGRPLIAKTCSNCGELHSAKYYRWGEREKAWRSQCRFCDAAFQNGKDAADPEGKKSRNDFNNGKRHEGGYEKAAQAITVPLAERSGTEYTEADYEVLRDPSITLLRKALKLKRTYSGVATICQKEGFVSHKGLGDPTRDRWHICRPAPERIREIQEEMGTTPELVTAGGNGWDWDD